MTFEQANKAFLPHQLNSQDQDSAGQNTQRGADSSSVANPSDTASMQQGKVDTV